MFPYPSAFLVMGFQKEDELGIYSGLRGLGSLDLKGANLYELVGLR